VVFEVWDAILDSIGDTPECDVRWVALEELSSVPHPSWVRKAIELRSVE